MLIYERERERERERQRWAGEGQTERETESEAGSRLRDISTELDMGLELTNCEIMTWAEGRRLTDWATQVPQEICTFRALKSFETYPDWRGVVSWSCPSGIELGGGGTLMQGRYHYFKDVLHFCLEYGSSVNWDNCFHLLPFRYSKLTLAFPIPLLISFSPYCIIYLFISLYRLSFWVEYKLHEAEIFVHPDHWCRTPPGT